jgi:hypothetical protein
MPKSISVTSHAFIFNVDKTEFLFNNIPPKTSTAKGFRDCIKFISAEDGSNVTVVACCRARDTFSCHFVIFNRISFREIYEQDLPSDFELGFIWFVIFLQGPQQFISTCLQGNVY